jgi:N-glycosylase/DNA lyase
MRPVTDADLRALYEERKARIKARLVEFARVPAERYFYELLYCLMTPQSSAENAEKAVRALERLRFAERGADPEPILRTRAHYIRFHKQKARRLLEAREALPRIRERLSRGGPPSALREWLVEHVKGLGYKEATHFLRNVGKNGDLAILDRHILRNLERFGAIRSVPACLTRRRYLAIERKFRKLAEEVRIPLNELDLLFWSMETGIIRK